MASDVRWIASRGRVMHPGVHGQLPGADHDFAIMGGDEQAEALAETINADLRSLQTALAAANARAEAAEAVRDKTGDVCAGLLDDLQAQRERTEAAERERDEVARINRTVGYDWSRAFNSWRIDFEQRITVTEAERDEAVGLLREVCVEADPCFDEWNEVDKRVFADRALGKTHAFLARLPSVPEKRKVL